MNTYKISKNNHQLGVAKGKNKAVNYLKKTLTWDGVVDVAWLHVAGDIVVRNGEDKYTIQKES